MVKVKKHTRFNKKKQFIPVHQLGFANKKSYWTIEDTFNMLLIEDEDGNTLKFDTPFEAQKYIEDILED